MVKCELLNSVVLPVKDAGKSWDLLFLNVSAKTDIIFIYLLLCDCSKFLSNMSYNLRNCIFII